VNKPSLFELTEPFIEPFEPEQRKMQAQPRFAGRMKRETAATSQVIVLTLLQGVNENVLSRFPMSAARLFSRTITIAAL